MFYKFINQLNLAENVTL